MSRRIIDMRSRPAFLDDFYGARPGTAAYNVAKWLNRRVGAKDDEHFRRSYDLEGFVSEIREVGITRAVVVGRDTPDLSIPNDTIHQITAAHEELVGVASVDSQTQGTKGAVAEIDRAVNRLGLKAVNCEPGFGKPALRADDVSLRPFTTPVRNSASRSLSCRDRRRPILTTTIPQRSAGLRANSQTAHHLQSRILPQGQRDYRRSVSL